MTNAHETIRAEFKAAKDAGGDIEALYAIVAKLTIREIGDILRGKRIQPSGETKRMISHSLVSLWRNTL